MNNISPAIHNVNKMSFCHTQTQQRKNNHNTRNIIINIINNNNNNNNTTLEAASKLESTRIMIISGPVILC
jgi:hypothetical protein